MNETQRQLMSIVSGALFDTPVLIEEYAHDLFREASMQAVQPLVYSVIHSGLDGEEAAKWKQRYSEMVRKSLQIEYQHEELHRLMEENQIPYVILKGCASGYYYPNPSLRSYGDVDFLVKERDMEMAGKLLGENGFERAVEDDGKAMHIAYHRKPNDIWELHRSVNGIPAGGTGETVRMLMSDVIGTSHTVTTETGQYRIPDTFHHGLVLLLHTASHLTSEGVGLRHLCDWAVFVNRVPDFEMIFKEKLQKCGLWKFAGLLTQVSVRYIGLPKQSWADEVEEDLLEELMEDILHGGNFGTKDDTRHAQIKYIKNRGEGTVGEKSSVRQALDTIQKKAQQEEKSAFAVITDYLGMVARGERKMDNRKVLDAAEKRKRLYRELQLFDVPK